MTISDEIVIYTEVTCMDCGKDIVWTTDYEPVFNDADPEYNDVFRCMTCAKKTDPWDPTKQCWNCGALYTSLSAYSETCSSHCGYVIDGLVEKAQDAALAREQRWLESYGEDES